MGGSTTEEQILDQFPPKDKEHGYSLGELRAIAFQYQYRPYVFKGNIEVLKQQLNLNHLPIVALRLKTGIPLRPVLEKGLLTSAAVKLIDSDFNHFVIVMDISTEHVIFYDSVNDAYLEIEIENFLESWSTLNYATLVVTAS